MMADGGAAAVRRIGRVAAWITVSVLLALQAGCKEQPKPQPPPPPKVTVAQPVRQVVTDNLDLTGNTQAIYTVQLVARVALVEDGLVLPIPPNPETSRAKRERLVVDAREQPAAPQSIGREVHRDCVGHRDPRRSRGAADSRGRGSGPQGRFVIRATRNGADHP